MRRTGFGVFRIALDYALLAIHDRAPKLLPAKPVARAATRFKRNRLARELWGKVPFERLSKSDIEAFTQSLLRSRGWHEASQVIERAKARGLGSITLELNLAEAMWRLEDSAGLAAARSRAIAMLPNKTQGAISLIENQNQVIDIPSRLALLQQVEGYIEDIRAEAASMQMSAETPKAYVYWHSGFTTAPKMVQACVAQAAKVYGSDLVQLDQTNLEDYLELGPQLRRVAKLWPAQYADVVRIGLMATRGGVWLDATIFTTENSIENLGKYLAGDFFVFNYNGPRIANWFMVADSGSYQARLMYAAMNAYWRRNRRLKNYFIFHDMFEVLYHLDTDFRLAFDGSTHLHAGPFLQLQSKQLFNPFDQAEFDRTLAEAPIQKLTYKPGTKNQGKGTLYHRLIDE